MDLSNYNLTPSSKKAISNARFVADNYEHLKVVDLHLLLSILSLPHANIDYVLEKNSILKRGLTKTLEFALYNYKEPRRKKKIFAPEITEILDFALVNSKQFKDDFIGVDHIMLSILATRDDIVDFLTSLELNIENLVKDLEDVVKNGIPNNSVPAGPVPKDVPKDQNINNWCENINEKILKRGDFEIFGRNYEIDRVFEILLRKNKSNVILVGEAGVGKTAIVDGIAEKIVKRECPDLLLGKQILSLDLTSVLAGTIYRGQMEEKIKNILETISESKNYILFIDEIHNIIGAGSSEGSMDFANMLKPALSRDNISCIGATTKNEYDRYFKRDSALNRRFEKVDVSEPSKEDTLELILKAKKSYEKFHQVKYSENLLEKIVDLCEIYLRDKKFPDKAFDILDESGAKTKKLNIVRPQKAKDMEKKLYDSEFRKTDEFSKFEKKYIKIIENWGKKVKKQTFDVDIDVIYDIFARKLNTSKENIKENKKFAISGKIGF
jgi:ATP-dependent Clp protease ATP-binding subunit ClpC